MTGTYFIMNIYTNTIPAYEREKVVFAALHSQDADLDTASRQEKYDKMQASPYRFFRGANQLFWADFADDWRLNCFGNAFTRTWIQGDAHVYNMGAFSTPEHGIVFGLDDFDDAIIADYQYDVWRMAVSIALVLRDAKHLDAEYQKQMIQHFAEAYLSTLVSCPEPPVEEIHFTKSTTYGKLAKFLAKVEKKESRDKMLDKWTVESNGVRRFDLSAEKLAPVSPELREKMIKAIHDQYRQTLQGTLDISNEAYFYVLDVAQRLKAGTGSLGLNRYYVLISGDTQTRHKDCILDIKQQPEPTPYLFLSHPEQVQFRSQFQHYAEAHAVAFRALADAVDQYLGWLTLDGIAYSVRERSPFKEDFPVEKLKKKRHFRQLAAQWGIILATQHKRAAVTLYADKSRCFFEQQVRLLTDNQHDAFCQLVTETAFHYADQVECDWRYFLKQCEALIAA
jgi:uncharacterized protein (DUF2252 family)